MKRPGKSIVLLGGSGFIGTALSGVLRAEGNRVISVSRHTPERTKGITYDDFDITKDGERLNRVLNDAETVVVMTRPDSSIIDSLKKALLRQKGIKRLIYLSSLLLYADSGKKHNEAASISPLTIYEKAKAAEEKELVHFCAGRKLPLTIARLANVYGNERSRGAIGLILESLIAGKSFQVFGGGDHKRDFLHIEDCANLLAFLCGYSQKAPVEIFNLCTGKAVTINQLIKLAERFSKKKLPIERKDPIEEKKSILGDNAKILKLSGYVLRYDIVSGLENSIKSIKKTA